MALELVKDDKGAVKVNDDGHVLYRDSADGKEFAFDGARYQDTLRAIREERDQAARERDEFVASLKDLGKTPEEIRSAVDKLKKAQQSKQSGGGDKPTPTPEDLDALVAERVRPLQESLEKKLSEETTARDQRIAELQNQLRHEKIEKWMKDSKALERYFLTGSAAYRMVGEHFDIDAKGNVIAWEDPATRKRKLYSRSKPSEIASPDEALEILLEQFPGIEDMRKGAGSSGGGAQGGEGASSDGKRRLSVERFQQLSPAERQKFINEGGVLVD